MLVIERLVSIDSIFFLKLRSQDNLLQQRERLPYILLETRELKDNIEVVFSPH